MPTIEIPTPLRPYTQQQSEVHVQGDTVRACLSDLTTNYPDLQKHLRDKNGKLRSFVNIYLGDEDIRGMDNEDTEVDADEVLTIVPSIAGGVDV